MYKQCKNMFSYFWNINRFKILCYQFQINVSHVVILGSGKLRKGENKEGWNCLVIWVFFFTEIPSSPYSFDFLYWIYFVLIFFNGFIKSYNFDFIYKSTFKQTSIFLFQEMCTKFTCNNCNEFTLFGNSQCHGGLHFRWLEFKFEMYLKVSSCS